jgi:hypothetical protein
MAHPLRSRVLVGSRTRSPALLCCAVGPILVSLGALAPPEGTVETSGARARELRSRAPAEDDLPPGPHAASRRVTLTPAQDGLTLEATWQIETDRAGFFSGLLTGAGIEIERATIAGRPAPLLRTPGGAFVLARIERDATIELVGFVPTKAGEPIELDLLPAARGRLTLGDPHRALVPVDPSEGPTVGFASLGDAIVGGARRLALELREPGAARPERGPLAEAHTAIGLTVGDAEIKGRAHVRWEVLRGALSSVRARVRGLGEDLEVEGTELASWRRDGDDIEVQLRGPARGRVEIDLSWTHATPSGAESRLDVPMIAPQAWHTDAALQLARDGDIEIVPALDEWDAVASADLPEWGEGLVEGTPTAAYRAGAADRGGTLELLRFVPVPGPPLVVDVAATTIATTEEGRMLAVARYEVRNDRASHLEITPPPGVRIVGARVFGETARPARDGDAWRIPLERSLETVDGLVSFPVEVVLLGEGVEDDARWKRRERRLLRLPVLDAPIAASRVTVYLPPDYDSRIRPGEGTVVDAFTEGEGITYGSGLGAADVAVADATFQSAVRAYLDNDFDTAQAELDELARRGASNENTRRLQGNLDVLHGKSATDAAGEGRTSADGVLARRVRDQARARATEAYRQQAELEREADELHLSGDYEGAEDKLEQAISIGGELEKLEQRESVEQSAKNQQIAGSLVTVKRKLKSRRGGRQLETKRASTTPRAIEPLSPPRASASALSVAIPAVGHAVLYQELLVEPGRAPTVRIDARRPFRAPRRHAP